MKKEELTNRIIVNEKGNDLIFTKRNEANNVVSFVFKQNDEYYFFKSNSKYSKDVTEILATAIAEEVGLKTNFVQPAVFVDEKGNKIEGMISKNITPDRIGLEVLEGKSLLQKYKDSTYICNTLEDYVDCIKNLKADYAKDDKNLVVEKGFLKEFKKQIVFYFLTANEDCHSHNVVFNIRRVGDNTYSLSLEPLVDKSISLLIKSFNSKFYSEDFETLPEMHFDYRLEKELEITLMPLHVYKTDGLKISRTNAAKEISELMQDDAELKAFYDNFKNINYKKLFNNYIKKHGFEKVVSQRDINFANKVCKQTVKQLDFALSYQNMQNFGPMKFLKQASQERDLTI